MTPLAQSIGNLLHQSAPRPLCLSCLALQQGVAQHDVRSVALVLMVRQGVSLVQRTCAHCHRVGEALVAQKSA